MENNLAIKTLMDDSLMIGRHRPIVAKWFQAWVDEYVASRRVEEKEDYELVAMELKADLLKKIEDSFTITVEKACLAEGWRRGTPYPQGSETGKEVTVKFYGFRNGPKE